MEKTNEGDIVNGWVEVRTKRGDEVKKSEKFLSHGR
jgi:hypothetical protein